MKKIKTKEGVMTFMGDAFDPYWNYSSSIYLTPVGGKIDFKFETDKETKLIILTRSKIKEI